MILRLLYLPIISATEIFFPYSYIVFRPIKQFLLNNITDIVLFIIIDLIKRFQKINGTIIFLKNFHQLFID